MMFATIGRKDDANDIYMPVFSAIVNDASHWPDHVNPRALARLGRVLPVFQPVFPRRDGPPTPPATWSLGQIQKGNLSARLFSGWPSNSDSSEESARRGKMADFWDAGSSAPTLGSCMVLILFFDSLIVPLSICSVLFDLSLRFAQTFHKVILRITATFIIAAILFSCDAEYNEVPCSVTILIFLMIFSCVVNIHAVVQTCRW
jgi:hypothetical protein